MDSEKSPDASLFQFPKALPNENFLVFSYIFSYITIESQNIFLSLSL